MFICRSIPNLKDRRGTEGENTVYAKCLMDYVEWVERAVLGGWCRMICHTADLRGSIFGTPLSSRFARTVAQCFSDSCCDLDADSDRVSNNSSSSNAKRFGRQRCVEFRSKRVADSLSSCITLVTSRNCWSLVIVIYLFFWRWDTMKTVDHE